ncbi:4-diphosphocytidyl-2-C-methyl-D-erythritol kinase [Alicyclobacillus cellulosilyticus]|uniref:4-diphosphocytidyl-2-C-methyl-D-erythritol kinase n=1 Tax=Alicyclobacillus cellulosilyticus TaxID=1003997 RepID=A0A917KC45_9BACL|nr:4-(cytidine 5'-diphospho)-2-C-methyl-D-erythritol kinase [Alicyclobacillus cellulosilyticus]GGJ08767.1 4-diphosphocytidyl-2-C-methyl-D-erythritol kinase [Alicyclobacillus cellulosilyticus]
MLAERAYAKINLTLDVLGRRPDGYHEVDMVLQTIDLSDLIWLEDAPSGVIEVSSNAANIPTDARNLAVAAARALSAACGLARGVRIRIDKQIPVAAGLAGGSADAAAVLRGLNRMWQLGLSADELAAIGAQVGSDVPFCVLGGCALATGRGEQLRKVDHDLRAWVVLVRPPVFVSTAEVYGTLTPDRYAPAPASRAMIPALLRRDFDAVRRLSVNGLAAATLARYPEVRQMWQRVEQAAHVPVQMSGSGPTLYCLLPARSMAQRLYNALRGFAREVYLCRFVS